MASGRHGSASGSNGMKKKRTDNGVGAGDSCKSRKHRKKEKQSKADAPGSGVSHSDREACGWELRGAAECSHAEGEPPQRPLGTSPPGDRSTQSGNRRERNREGAGTSDSARHLIVGNDGADQVTGPTRSDGETAADVYETVTPVEIIADEVILPSPAGSPDVHLRPHVHSGGGEAVNIEDGEQELERNVEVVDRTPNESHTRRAYGLPSMHGNTLQCTRRPDEQNISRSVQSVRTMEGSRGPNGPGAVMQAMTTASIGAQRQFSHGTQGRGRAQAQVSSTAPEGPALQVAINVSSALQQLHVLVRALNPMEREAFLRTHDLVRDLERNVVEEPRDHDGTRPAETEDIQPPEWQRQPTVADEGPLPEVPGVQVVRSPRPPPPVFYSGRQAAVNSVDLSSEWGADGCDPVEEGVLLEDSGGAAPTRSRLIHEHGRTMRRAERTLPSEQDKGKAAAEEEDVSDHSEEDRANRKLIKHVQRQLRTGESDRKSKGDSSKGRQSRGESSKTLGQKPCPRTAAKEMVYRRKKRRELLSATTGLGILDPLGPEWAALRDVPPLEVNRLGEPTGAYWDYMQPYVYDRGAFIFPWEVNWDRQCKELKARFLFRLRKLFPGPWEAKVVLTKVGTNLRERRNRLKKRFKVYSNIKAVPRPKGCSLQSWKQIYHDLRDPKKKQKSELCKRKADERIATGVSPFSHRTGRGGYRGIVARFEDEFQRPPSGSEIDYARKHGWAGLADRTRSWANRLARASPTKRRKRQAASEEESCAQTSSSEDSEDDNNDWPSNRDHDGTSSDGRATDTSAE